MDPNRYRLTGIIILLCAGSFVVGRISVRHNPPPAPPEVAPLAEPLAASEVAPAPRVERVQLDLRSAPAVLAKRWDDSQWEQLNAQPATVARNKELAALLETLAATDPQRALALAQAEKNLKTRETFLSGALRGWGGAKPEDAANWAIALADPVARSAAINSVFTGAAAKPDEALGVIQKLVTDNPGEATDCGIALISAFCDAGNFSAALKVVEHNVGEAQRSILVADAYSRWAALQPEQAAQAAIALTDRDARLEALHGVIGGWAQADPEALTRFVSELPPAEDRADMLGQALTSWARTDPVSVANWINERGDTPDFDEGIAAVASVNFVKPDFALNWAETITDAKLRSDTIANVLHGWVLEDAGAAKKYMAETKNLLAEDRQRLNEIIATGEQVER